MKFYSIQVDADGDLEVGDDAPPMLATFLRNDVNTDLDFCDRLLGIVSQIRFGQLPLYQSSFDVTRIALSPEGARISIAAKLAQNQEVLVPLDEFEDGLRRTRLALSLQPGN